MLCALLVLLLQEKGIEPEDAALRALSYLARHQASDGSWGVPPSRCDCAPKVSGALPELKITSLSLLAFVGNGYHSHSKEVYHGVSFGEVIRRGFKWLTARMQPDGSFGAKDLEGELLATLALAQIAWLSGNTQYGAEARKAVERVTHLSLTYPPATIWKCLITEVAEGWDYSICSEHPKNGYGLDCPRGRRGQKKAERALSNAWQDAESKKLREPFWPPQPGNGNVRDFMLSTLRYYWLVGAKSAEWKAWSPCIQKGILSQMLWKDESCTRGSWKARSYKHRIELTAYHALTLQIYYRYVQCLAQIPH